MAELAIFSQPDAPSERIVAAAELAELRRNPQVIDGEWYVPRPIWPILAASIGLLALGVASVVQEVVR